jgi:hypothetical protein
MNERFTIPANDAQAYSLMRTYDLTDDDLSSYISTMLGELKVLADYAKLPGVASNITAALSELKAAKS